MEKIKDLVKDLKDVEFCPDVHVLEMLEARNQAIYMILSFILKALKILAFSWTLLSVTSSILSLV